MNRSFGAARREPERSGRTPGSGPERSADVLAVPSDSRRRSASVQYTEEELASVAALGHLYFEHRHLKEAQVVFAGLMVIDPSDEYYARGFAAACLLEGETARALEAVNRAVEVAQDPRPALLLRAQILVARRSSLDAERDLNYIIRMCKLNRTDENDPVLAMARLMLSRVRSLTSGVSSQAVAGGARR